MGGATRGDVLGVIERLQNRAGSALPQGWCFKSGQIGECFFMFVVGGATRGDVLGKDFKSKRIAASGPSHRVFFLNLVKRGSVMSCLLWEARLAAMFWVSISRLKESRRVGPPTGAVL